MIRERICRTALRAYPSEVRAARGDEMLGTLLDVSARSHGAFARESASLVIEGLRERAAGTAKAGSRRLVADACAQAVAILTVVLLRNGGHAALASPGASAALVITLVLLMALLVCVLVGYDRTVGCCGLGLTVAALILADPHAPFRTRSVTVALLLVPLGCFTVMAFAPRARTRDARRLIWLLPAAALAAVMPYSSSGSVEFLAVISAAAIIALPADPRFAIACGLAWTALALPDGTLALTFPRGQWIPAVAGALLMFTIATTRLRIMRSAPQP